MPGSATALRQERLKKTHARPVPLGLFTINEEDEQQKNGHSRRPKGMHQPYPVVRAQQPPEADCSRWVWLWLLGSDDHCPRDHGWVSQGF